MKITICATKNNQCVNISLNWAYNSLCIVCKILILFFNLSGYRADSTLMQFLQPWIQNSCCRYVQDIPLSPSCFNNVANLHAHQSTQIPEICTPHSYYTICIAHILYLLELSGSHDANICL